VLAELQADCAPLCVMEVEVTIKIALSLITWRNLELNMIYLHIKNSEKI
jgi:hypothetical protein